MKKTTKKLALLLFTVMFLLAGSAVTTAFAADKTISITLRIEGIEQNLFYGTVEVPYSDSLTLQQALTYIDTQEDSIAITGLDTDYITDINGEASGTFGGWDGWLYKVNGLEPTVAISGMELVEGDSILLYYGDPYGVGMQFPKVDTSKLSEGVITFTSSDTTYDANYNPVVKVNPVKGATVTWSNGDTATEYVTNEKGSITIDTDQLTKGSHTVQITKTGKSKQPLVLRFAPDYMVTVDSIADNTTTDKVTDTNTLNSNASDTDMDTASNTKASASQDSEAATQAPKTGEQTATTVTFLILAITALCGIILLKRKENNEKKESVR
jgi:LPXTG-motif cell wall-anchored protein